VPHDKNGVLLAVGDRVVVEFEVKEIYVGEEYCNVSLVVPGAHGPHNVVSSIVCNAKQVEKSLITKAADES